MLDRQDDPIDLSGSSSRMPVDPIEIFISAFQTLAVRLFCFFAPLFVSTVTAKYLCGVDLGPRSWTEPWKDFFSGEALLAPFIFPAEWLWLFVVALLRSGWALLALPFYCFLFLAVVVFGRFPVYVFPTAFGGQGLLVFVALDPHPSWVGWASLSIVTGFLFGITYVFWGVRSIGLPLVQEWKGKPGETDPAFLRWRPESKRAPDRVYIYRAACITWIIRCTASWNWELRWHDQIGAGGFCGVFPFPEAAVERVVGRTTGFSAWDELKEQTPAPGMASLEDWESLERNPNGRWVRV